MKAWTIPLLCAVSLCFLAGGASAASWQHLLDRADSLVAVGNPDSANAVVDRAFSGALTRYGPSDTTAEVRYYVEGVLKSHFFRSYADAESLYRRVASLKERIWGADDPEVAASLQALGLFYLDQNKCAKAEPILRRALAIRKQALGLQHPDVGRSLRDLGCLMWVCGNYAAAESLCIQSLPILEEALGPDHLDVAVNLNYLAMTHVSLDLYDDVEELHKRALAIRERVLGPDDPDVANSLNNLAAFYWYEGRYAEATDLFGRVLTIWERAYGPEHPLVSLALNNMAVLSKVQGKYAQAERLYRRSLAIKEKTLAPDHPDVALVLNNLALLCSEQGRYSEAEPLYKRSIAISEKSMGPEHPAVASSLNNLALLYHDQGRYAEAEPLYRRAMSIWEKTNGPEYTGVALILNNLGLLYSDQGKYAEAEPLYKHALTIWETTLGPEHPDVALGLMNLAKLYRDQGKFDEAEPLYKHALAIREKALGPDHPEIAFCLENYSQQYRMVGDNERALELAKKALAIREENLRDGLTVLSERDALAYSQLLRASAANLLSIYVDMIADGTPVDYSPADVILSSKGPVSEASFARKLEMNELASLGGLADSLRAARDLLSDLYVGGPDEDDVEGYRKALDDAAQAKERYERKLAASSESYRSLQDVLRVDSDKVREVLSRMPEPATLVEYMKFDYQSREPGVFAPHYLALVISGKGRPEVIDLGEASEIDRLVDSYRSHVSHLATSGYPPAVPDQVEYRMLSEALFARVWQPIESLVSAEEFVLIAPDGGLGLISFAGLIDGEGRYLIEDHILHYLSSGRDLVRLEDPGIRSSGLLALGDPDYSAPALARLGGESESGDEVIELADARLAADMRNVRSGCGEIEDIEVSPLPGTREEVELIASRWEESADVPAEVLLGNQASEERLKAEAPGMQVVHLATHGYFLEGACRPETGKLADFASAEGFVGENPLLLSGLFLAGANLHGDDVGETGADDGVLTAEEVMSMNLAGTQLVVLSACETGLGRVTEGEGVYGLRRAFQVAGARTVVSALWPVADEATAEMMGGLYDRSQQSLPETLRRIQLDMISRLRRNNMPDHPFTWAPFIALGDWR